MLIMHIFQCLEVRCVWLLATCGSCIMSPTPASFSPAFAADLWITILVRGGGRTRSVCAQGFPKGNTQAPSLCCISQSTECCTAEHDVGSRASLCEWSCWVCQACGEGRVHIIFLLHWKLCATGEHQSYFWLRIAMDVWREEHRIANMDAPEDHYCLTLVRGLRSFVVWPTENWKTFVQHLLLGSVLLNVLIAQE